MITWKLIYHHFIHCKEIQKNKAIFSQNLFRNGQIFLIMLLHDLNVAKKVILQKLRKYYSQNILIQCYSKHLQLILMEYQARISNKPNHYAKIPLSKRMALVEQVINQSLSIRKVAKKLNIKTSTAKLIIKKYKEDGTFFQKRSDRLSRLAQTKESTSPTPLTQISFLPTPPTTLSTAPQPIFLYDFHSSFESFCISNRLFVALGEWAEMVCYPQMGFVNFNTMATQFGSFY